MKNIIVVVLCLSTLLFSCQSVNKVVRKKTTTYDSTSVVTKDYATGRETVQIKKSDLVAVGAGRIILEYAPKTFDSAQKEILTVPIKKVFRGKEKALDKLINGLLNDRLQNVTIDGNFKITDKSITETNTKDTSISKEVTNSAVSGKTKEANIDVERKGIPTWKLLVGGAIVVAILILILYFKNSSFIKYFSLWKRKSQV